MDRTAWIVVILCVIGLVLWELWIAKQTPQRPRTTTASPTPAPPLAASSASPAPFVSPVPAATPRVAGGVPSFPEKIETLRNADAELRLTNRGGGIGEAVLLNHVAEGDKRVTLNSPRDIPIGAIIEQPDAPELPEFNLSREADGSVQCERTTLESITVRKKFLFAKTTEPRDNFLVELDVDLTNGGTQPYANSGYFVALGSAVPIHARDYPYYTRLVWCIDGRAKDKNVSWFEGGSGFFGVGQRAPQPFYQENTAPAEWVAVTNQFFTTLIVPLTAKSNGVWGRRINVAPEQKMYGIEGAMHMPGFQLPAGQTYSARFEIYAGPKIYHQLAQLEHNEAEIMNFGLFKLVSQFLLNFMNLLHGVLWNSYAAAVLALTTIIRLVLWPLQSKANRSMRQMAALGPKMQELREKYKDDPTRMNQEVMKLYKEYGINPAGGCLPMMIQIPIFFGLYQMLAQAVELRNAKFLWVRDLSQPDTVAHLPMLGWPINIIPLCMAATQIWLMQMTPKTGDATQRRVMMFTPLIFLFFCYNFAAALALYYTAQNLFSILQFYLNKQQPMPKLEKVAPAARRKR
jgi:YidC/Oxa1 family membrane protein insertase